MFSSIVFALAFLAAYQSLPDRYFISVKTNTSQTNNSKPVQLVENEDSSLEQFVRSYPIPSKFYNDQWNNNQNLNLEPAKHLFFNQPSVFPIQPVPLPDSVFAQSPVQVLPLPNPFPIQQPAIGIDGQVIIENLLGGVAFNCWGRQSGHYRDTYFCDVFHACVHGYQRKTYSCPFVGETQYFNEVTQKCEFFRKNPLACASKVFYH